MSGPDVDEVLDYLSKKFNKIFCDRDFVCCVIEDFQTILKSKNKICLVFPTLGPIYLKALRYQAKIFDLIVFNISSASGKFKSIAVCHKEHLRKKEETMSEKKKRPERQLYVPPAQRLSRLSKSTSDKKFECQVSECVLTLSDVLNLSYFFNNLPCKFGQITKSYQHNCVFEKFLKFKQFDHSLSYDYFIKIYDNFLLLNSVCWKLSHLFCSPKSSNKFQSYPFYSFDNPDIATKPVVAVLVKNEISNFNQTVREINLFENNLYKIQCDTQEPQNHEIADLSTLGHFFIISVNGSDYIHECQEQHDATLCCENVRKQLELDRKLSKLNAINETVTNGKKNPRNEIVKNQKNKKVSEDKHEQEKEIMRMTKEYINRKTRPIMKYVDDDDTLRIDKNDESINNWEDLFDDEGQIQEELLSEIVDKVGDDVTIVKVNEDYTPYTNKPPEELEHIVELYNFPSTLETHDLVQAFSDINSDAMYIKWVDDTHALLVLGSLSQAQKAINRNNPLIKVRPMTAASAISLDVANKSDLKPAMKRPPTNLQTARRLITSHLGTKSKLTKEQVAKEKQDLKNAREMKRMLKQHEKDAWEGNLRSSVN